MNHIHFLAKRLIKIGLAAFFLLFFVTVAEAQPERDTLAPMWSRSNSPSANDITFLKVDSNNVLYMGMWGGGLRRSNNDGVSWTPINNGLTNTFITSFEIDSAGNYYVGTFGGGVFKSTNRGVQWTAVNAGLWNQKIKTITIRKGGPVFAGTYGGGVFRSTNGGGSWTQINNGIWMWDITAMMVNVDGVILAGTNGDGIYRSDDDGNYWRRSNGSITSRNITSFWVNDLNEIYCGTLGGGVNYSVSSGLSWAEYKKNSKVKNVLCVSGYVGQEPIAGLSDFGIWKYDSQIYEDWRATTIKAYGCNSIVKNKNGVLFAGIPHLGLYKSTNGGMQWDTVSTLFAMDTSIKPMVTYFDGVVLASNNTGQIYYSKNYGNTWSITNIGAKIITAAAFDSVGYAYVSTTMDSASVRYGSLYKSTDNGNSWSLMMRMKDSVINAICAKPNGVMFVGITFPPGDPKNPNAITSEILRTTNFGLAWTHFAAKAGYGGFRFIKASPAGDIFTTLVPGVMRSQNNGTSWTRVKDSTVTSFDIAFNSLGHLFLATDNGIQKSTNMGANWTINKVGYTYSWAHSIAVTKRDEVYVAMQSQEGIFRSENLGATYDSVNIPVPRGYAGGIAISPEGVLYVSTTGIFKTIEPSDLVPPNLDFPADFAGGQSLNPTLGWNSAPRATLYELQVSPELDFSNLTETVTLGDTVRIMNRGLNYNSVYFWRVRSRFNNSKSDWSPLRQFLTIIKYPTLVAPKNDAQAMPVSFNLVWNKVDGAGGYLVQVSKDPGFGANIVNKELTDSTLKLSNLELYTKYYWRVQAKANKTYSDWSEVWSFTTRLKPPTLKAPAHKTYGADTIATLEWNPINGANGYEVQLAKDSLFKVMIFEGETENLDLHHTKLLEYFTKYWWRIRAKDDYGVSDWSDPWFFITTLPAPLLVKPFDNTPDLSVDSVYFEWTENSDATNYHIQIAKDQGFGDIVYDSQTLKGKSTSFQKFDYFTDYYWKLRIKNNSYFGLWSEVRTFKTGIDRPVLTSPADKLANVKRDIIFFWDLVNGADVYQIQVATDDKFTSKLVDQDSIRVGRYQKDGFPYESNLFWRVKAKYDKGQSFWSDTWSLTVEKKDTKSVNDPIVGMDANIYPNPFSSYVTFDLKLEKSSPIRIAISNMAGEELAVVYNSIMDPGTQSIRWDPVNFAQGTYIYTITVGTRTYIGQINYVK